jgi:hypothetical protein
MNTSPERQANTDEQDEMLPEYDFSGKTGVRGKYYQAMRNGYTIKINRQDGTTLVQHISRPEGTITRLFRKVRAGGATQDERVNTRWRSRSNLARPYMQRLITFRRLT